MLKNFERVIFSDIEDKSKQAISSVGNQQYSSSINLISDIQTKLIEGKHQLCLDYIDSLPASIFDHQPQLRLFKAIAMVYCDFPVENIRQIILDLEKNILNEEIKGEVIALKAKIEVNIGHINQGIQLSHKAYSKIDKENTFFRKLIERNLGTAYTIKGDLRNAVIWFENLLLSAFKINDFTDILVSYHYLAHIHKVQSQFKIAEVIYRKALTFISKHQLEKAAFSIKLFSGYGHLLIQRNEINVAIDHLTRAIRLAEKTNPLYAHAAYHSLCEAYVREGSLTKAFQIIKKFQDQIGTVDDRYKKLHSEYASASEARINLAAGRVDEAYRWLLSRGFFSPSAEIIQKNSLFELGYSLPIAANIYISKGMHSQAIDLLSPIIPKFVHRGANAYLIRVLNALAIAYYHSGDSLKAKIIINKTIRLAEPENNIGDFIFTGKRLIPLLSESLKNNASREFILMLISVLSSTAEVKLIQTPFHEDTSALSRREMEVLQLLSKGLTNQEIADNLFLSANTIKSHTIKIYRKLNVNNRKRAVRKARLIGLLPENTIQIPHPST